MNKILVVDDNRNYLVSLCIGLRRNGLLVDSATNGFDAFEMINEHHYDFLLTDIRMKGMSGIDLAKITHKRFPAMQIMLMSAYDFLDMDSVDNIVLEKFFKPFDLASLLQVIDEKSRWIKKYAGASK